MKKIKEVKLNDIKEFVVKYFPKFKIDNNPFEKVYAYYLDDVIIGFISVSIIYEKAEINYIAVDLEYRRQGIAQELFNYFISNTKNIESISLEVNCHNEAAINFYLKNGFVKEAIRENYYNGEDAYLMVKMLEVK